MGTIAHDCRICGRYRANEKFSGRGHRTHVCKDCLRLPREERQFIEEEQEIGGYLSQSKISKKNLSWNVPMIVRQLLSRV
jgi:hypothetical protein